MTIVLGYTSIVLMGITLGSLGGGGSILTVPIFVYLFGLSPLEATTESLFIVGSIAAIGVLLQLKNNVVDFKNGLLFFIPSALAVILTKRLLLPIIPNTLLTAGTMTLTKPLLIMIVFAILMVLASLSMIRDKKTALKNNQKILTNTLVRTSAFGLIVGFATGFVGAGGGFLIVPALVNLLNLNMRKAVATSLLIIACNSALGFLISQIEHSQEQWLFLFKILLFALFGFVLGLSISSKIPDQILKKSFGYLVLIFGLILIADQLRHLT